MNKGLIQPANDKETADRIDRMDKAVVESVVKVNELTANRNLDIQETVSIRLPVALIYKLKKEQARCGITYVDILRTAIFSVYPNFQNENYKHRMIQAYEDKEAGIVPGVVDYEDRLKKDTE